MRNQLYTRDRSWKDFYDRIIDTLPNPDIILRSRGADVSIYRNLTFDSHVDSCMTSREAGLLSCEHEIATDGKSRADKKARDFIREVFTKTLTLNDIFSYILECIYFGYGFQEIMHAKDGDYILYEKIIGLPTEWFGFSYQDNSPLFFSKEKPIEGEPADMRSLNLIQYRASYKNPYGEGKLSRIFFPVSIKKAILKYGADFAEKFGSVFLFLITQNTDETKKQAALKMLFEMVQSGVGVFETNDTLKDLNVDKSGSGDLYTGLINLMNNEISKAILGQTLTTENNTNTGTQAMATVHFEVRKEIIDADKKFSQSCIDKLIKRLVDLNMTVDNYPYLKFFEKEDINLDRSTRDLNLQGLGVKFKPEYFINQYNFLPDEFTLQENNPQDNSQPGGLLEQSNSEGDSLNEDEIEETEDQVEDEKKNFSESDYVIFTEKSGIYQEDEQLEKFTKDTLSLFHDAYLPFYTGLMDAIEKSEDYDDAIERILKADFIDISKKVQSTANLFLTADIIGRAYTALNRDDNFIKFAEMEDPLDISKPIWKYADVDFLKMKIPMTKDKFDALLEEYKNYAFTISSYKRKDEVENALNHLIECKEQKMPFKEWKDDAIKKGIYQNDAVYWQNIRSSQMAGKYKEMTENIDIAPYWQYVAVVDKNTRPEHLALNGTIRRHDDPFWEKWFPPNGFGCRCTVRSLSADYLKNTLKLNPVDFDKKLDMPPVAESINNISKTQKGLSGQEKTFNLQLELMKQKLPGYAGKNETLNITPDKGFSNNTGKDLYSWTLAKESAEHSSGWKNIVNKKVKLIELLRDKESYNVKPYEMDNDLSKNEVIRKAVKYLENKLNLTNGIAYDKYGNAINFSGLNGFVKHLVEKEGQERLIFIACLNEVIVNPDKIISNVLVANQRLKIKGFTKVSKTYIKKVNMNNKDYFLNFTTNLSKYDKNYTGWTLYLENEPKGIIVK
ncbi:MAG: DUF935 family protein [Spirochaetes bacterium]|nr:DUF935 family protein [Spirochaetota bacterium]